MVIADKHWFQVIHSKLSVAPFCTVCVVLTYLPAPTTFLFLTQSSLHKILSLKHLTRLIYNDVKTIFVIKLNLGQKKVWSNLFWAQHIFGKNI